MFEVAGDLHWALAKFENPVIGVQTFTAIIIIISLNNTGCSQHSVNGNNTIYISKVCSLQSPFYPQSTFYPGFHFTPGLLFTPGLHFTRPLVSSSPLVFISPLLCILPLVFILLLVFILPLVCILPLVFFLPLVSILPLVFFLPLAFSLPLVFILTGPWSWVYPWSAVCILQWLDYHESAHNLLLNWLTTWGRSERKNTFPAPCLVYTVWKWTQRGSYLDMNKNKPNVISTDLFCWQAPEFVVCHL